MMKPAALNKGEKESKRNQAQKPERNEQQFVSTRAALRQTNNKQKKQDKKQTKRSLVESVRSSRYS